MMWKISILLVVLPLMLSCGLSESRIKREKMADSHYKLGIAHLVGKKSALQKAYIEFQKAVKLDRRNQKAYYALGHIFFQQESYEDAIVAFQKAISIDAEYSEAHNYLGRVYSLQEDFDKAITSYQNALKNVIYETPEKPYWNLGLIFVRQKKYEDAERELKNALRVNPNIVPVHNLLGQVYAKMGNTKKSIISYKRVLQISPKDLNALYNLACIYQQEGEKHLADKAFEDVVTLSPKLAEEKDLRACLNPVE